MLKVKILHYFILLGITLLACFLFMFIFVFIFSSREKGIAWGICTGIIAGKVLLSIFQKHRIISIILSTIVYSLLVFLCMYIITNYMKTLLNLVKYFLYVLSLIVSWEISLYIVSKWMSNRSDISSQ